MTSTPRPTPRPCGVCGRRVDSGRGRCAEHSGRAYALPVSCRVCGRLGPTSYCDEHRPDPFAETRSQAERVEAQPWRRGYRDPKYHRERQAALTRAKGACERCGRDDLELETDHIVPLSTARTPEELSALNDRSNLQALCRPCHRSKPRRRRA